MKSAFVSYSHRDIEFVEQFKRHLKSLTNKVTFWDDSRITAGQTWRTEIKKALDGAQYAILFISADFFNSDFIQEVELPILLQKAEEDGTVILSVILKPCMFSEYPKINKYQTVNNPKKSLLQMSEAEQEEVWVKLLGIIKGSLTQFDHL
jgi:hypothetical protein